MSINQRVANKFHHWFGKRMPMAREIKLNQKSTYILPTSAGYFVILILLLMMVGATNYQNNLAFLLTFLLVGIGLVCIVFTFKNLQGIQFKLGASHEYFAGKPVSLAIRVASQTGNAHMSLAIGESLSELTFFDVSPNHETQIELPLKNGIRGYWPIPRLVAASQYPFGWLKTWAYFQFDQHLLVYPKPVEPPLLSEKAGKGDESESGAKLEGNEDFYGLRSYQQGESLNRVDWKAYARERGLFVREFASYQSQLLSFDWEDFPNTPTELRLSYLTFMVLNAAQQNLGYALNIPGQQINFDEGQAHRHQCLKALALFEQFGLQSAEHSDRQPND